MELLLLKPVKQWGIHVFETLLSDYYNAAEILMHEAASAVCSNSDFTELLSVYHLVVLIEHVVE